MSTDSGISILIADDHPMIRCGLATSIGQDRRFRIAGTASNGREAVDLYGLVAPDLVLMDLSMPGLGGVEAIEQIRRIDSTARIVILTSFADEESIVRGLRAGARGYMLKLSGPDLIMDGLLAVLAGRRFVPQEIATKLADHLDVATLSRREQEILELMSTGRSNKRIAQAAAIAEGTVKFHVNNILSKLRVTGRTEAVALAIRRGMVKMEGSYG
jgi:DNA-binding NarL/FixJ family response regulator